MLASLGLLLTVMQAQVQPLEGNGSTYVFVNLTEGTDDICEVGRTTYLDLPDLLAGWADHEICIDEIPSTQSIAEFHFELVPDGFNIKLNGWGDAVGLGTHNAFSRHDTSASMLLIIPEDIRISVNWFYLAAGLGSFQLQLQRLYDLDGTWNPMPPVIDRSANAYIEPLTDNGYEMHHLAAGQWRVSAFSTHQAIDPAKEGFQLSFARTNHYCSFVPLGDVDGDAIVDVNDLLAVVDAWGPCAQSCEADLDSDGLVGIEDMLRVLADWSD